MEKIQAVMETLQTKSGLGFEPITDWKAYEQRKCDRYNAETGTLNEFDGYDCQLCKNKGFIAEVRYVEKGGYYTETHIPCKCQRARKAIKRLNRSGLKDVVRKYTFANYKTEDEWQKRLKEKATAFCKDNKATWFFIGGQSGAGKTHLCSAVTVQYIRDGYEAKYMLWRDEIVRLKAVVNDPLEYGEMMNELKTAPVLYIDDLFKNGKGVNGQATMPTPADVNAAFEIINYRYNNPALVTIISSEKTIAELNEIDEAIAGRIAELTKPFGYCLNIKKDASRNWRMKGVEEI